MSSNLSSSTRVQSNSEQVYSAASANAFLLVARFKSSPSSPKDVPRCHAIHSRQSYPERPNRGLTHTVEPPSRRSDGQIHTFSLRLYLGPI